MTFRNIWIAIVLTLLSPLALAQEPTTAPRLSIAATVAETGEYPGGVGQKSGLVAVDYSLWLGKEYLFGQLRAEWVGLVGMSESGAVHVATAPTLRFDLLPRSPLSWEFQIGLSISTQLGSAGVVPGVGFLGMGGWVLRPLQDKRYQFKLYLVMNRGFILRNDPANGDCPLCYGAVGAGLAFEWPL